VLLVEDNAVNRQVIQLQLKRLGHTVQAVDNGREAVEAVTQKKFAYSVVLMDVQMPEMDGLTATRLIRQAEAGTHTHLPIIAITAHARLSDRSDCLAAGMDDYLSKPIDILQLRETLARWMKTGPLAPAAPAAEAHERAPAPDPLSPPATDPLNAHAVSNLRELQQLGAPNFLHDFIDLYLRDTDGMLGTLRQAVDGEQREVVARIARQLKLNSQSLGADQLAALCQALAARADDSAPEAIKHSLSEVEEEYARVRVALRREEGPVH
jgi:CheY-like chemotaxis protein